MAFYRYTIIDQSVSLDEKSGVMEADSPQMAILKLIEMGYMVREIRVASQDDMRLERLKRFRKILRPDVAGGVSVVGEDAPIDTKKQQFSWSWVFAVLVMMLMLIYMMLEAQT